MERAQEAPRAGEEPAGAIWRRKGAGHHLGRPPSHRLRWQGPGMDGNPSPARLEPAGWIPFPQGKAGIVFLLAALSSTLGRFSAVR